jgi:hypothetical protein
MKLKIILLSATILTGSAAFAQDTTGSTRPQVIIPLGKKPAKKPAESYKIDTIPYNGNTVQPFPKAKTPARKTKKLKARKPDALPPSLH